MSRVLLHAEMTPQRPHWLAGAPGFEPGNGGIKIPKRILICIAYLLSCCICVASSEKGAPCRPQSSLCRPHSFTNDRSTPVTGPVPVPARVSRPWAIDRDRGEPRGSAPPTPPYVRVRIRRFEKLR